MDSQFKILLNAALNLQKSENEINKQIDKLKTESIKVGVELSTTNAKKSLKELSAESQKVLTQNKINFDNRLNTYLKNNTKLSSGLKDEILRIQSSIKSVDRTGLKSLQKDFSNVTSEAASLGRTGDNALTRLQKNTVQFLNYLGSATVIMTAVNSVRSLVTTVSDLDKSIVDLQQATGYSYSQTKELLNTYIDLGQQLGATGKEVADSAGEWLRQGKSISDTNELIKDSMILSKVGQIDSAQATELLTSAMKGYKVQVSDVLGIVDKLSAVDMSSATDVQGLATAMSRVASMASLAGVSMDKLLGYLAVVGETTKKEMSSIGESFQTIFSRMGNIKVGKFTEGKTGESLNDVEKVLTPLGIKLRDSEKSFRDFDKVLDDIGKRWSTLSQVEQNAIGVAIAGTRQRENFTVLMQNYSKALEYTGVSAASSGTAMQKFSAYEDSVESKTKKLQAGFEKLSTDTLNSGFIKGFLDASNVLVNFTDKIGLLNVALVGGFAALAKFSDSGITQLLVGLSQSIKSFGLSVIGKQADTTATIADTVAVEANTVAQEANATATAGIGAASKTASAGVGMLGTAMSLLPLVAVVGGIVGIVTLIDNVTTSTKELKAQVVDAESAYASANSELDSVNTQLKDQNDLMVKLSKKDKLTYAEEGQLDELKDITKELEIQADLANEKKQKSQKQLAVSSADLANRYGVTNFTASVDFNKQDIINRHELSTDKKDLSSLVASFEYLNELKKKTTNSEEEKEYYSMLSEYTDKYSSSVWDQVSILEKQKTNMKDYYDSIMKTVKSGGTITKEQQKVKDAYEQTASAIEFVYSILKPDKLKEMKFNDVFNEASFSEAKDKLEKLSKSGKLTPETISSNKEYKKLITETGLSATEVANQIDALSEKTKKSGEDADKSSKSYHTLSSTLKDLKDVNEAMSSLDSAYASLKSKEHVSFDNITKIQEAFKGTQGLSKFITLLSTSKSVTGEVQEAFNKLVGSYLETNVALNNLDDSNKKLITSQLEQMGVANASEIVDKRLAVQKQFLTEKGRELADATATDIIEFKEEHKVSGDVETALSKLAAQKAGVNNVVLSTQGDIENLLSLMNTAHATTNALSILARLKAGEKIYGANAEWYKNIQDEAQNEANDYYKSLNKKVTYAKTNYTGGAATKKTEDKSKNKKSGEDKYLENAQAQIAALKYKLDMEEISEKTYYDRLDKLNDKYFKGKKKYQEQYRQYNVEVYNGEKKLEEDRIKDKFDALKQKLDLGKITEAQYYKTLEEYNEKYYKKNKDLQDEYKSNLVTLYEYEKELQKKRIDNLADSESSVIDSFSKVISKIKDEASDMKDGSPEQSSKYAEGISVAKNEVVYLQTEIEKLNKLYKSGKIDTESYTSMYQKLQDTLDETNDSFDDLYESMASSFETDFESVIDNLSAAYDKLTDKINDSYDAYEKLINSQKESLEEQNDANDYAESIADKTKDITDTQTELAKINAAVSSGDREAIAKQKDLQKQLADEQKELNDTQADHELKTKEDLLDKSLDGYKDITDKQLEDAKTVYNTKLDNLKSLYNQEKELIKHISDYTQSEFASKISGLNTQIQDILKSLNTALESNVSGVGTDISGISNSSSYNNVAGAVSGVLNGLGSSYNEDTQIRSILQNGRGKDYGISASELNSYVMSKYGNPLSYEQMVQIAKIKGISGINSVDDVKGNDVNKNRILQALLAARFKETGKIKANRNSFLNSIGEHGLVAARDEEIILDQTDSKTFQSFIPIMKDVSKQFKPHTPNLSNLINNNSSDRNISVKFDSLISGITVSNDYDIVNGVKQNASKIANIITKEISSKR